MSEKVNVINPQEFSIQEQESVIRQQVSTAREFPRSLASVKSDVTALATVNRETAQDMFYAIPRGGATIEGLSVRFAELVAANWGNLRIDRKIVGLDSDKKNVISIATVHDLEKNNAMRNEVSRNIRTKQGKIYSDDMITTTGNAGCSIAMRNAIFQVIPMAFFADVLVEIKKVATGANTGETLSTRINKAFKYFTSAGVDESRIMASLGKASKTELTSEDLETLIGVTTAINQKETTLDDAFPPTKLENSQAKSDSVAQQAKQGLKKDK